MKKFLDNNLYLIFFFLTLIYIGFAFNKANIENQLFGDFPGHLYQSKSLFTNVDSAIYNFDYFLGFYPALYPPLTSYIRDISLGIMSVKNYVLIFYLVNFYIFYLFINKIFGKNKVNNPFFVLIFLYFLFASAPWLIVVYNLRIGSMPSLLGFNLLIIYIYYFLHTKRNNYKVSLILGLIGGLIFLTHAITASVYILLFTSMFLLDILRYKQNKVKFMQIKVDFFAGLSSLLIGIPWIYSLLYLQNQIPKLGIEGYASIETILLIGVLFFLFLVLLKYKLYNFDDKDIVLLTTSVILISIGTTSKYLSIQFSNGLHIYRYFPYAIYILLIFLGRIYKKLIGVSHFKYQLFGIIFLIYVSFSLIINNDFYFNINLNIPKTVSLVNKRFLDISENIARANAASYLSTKLVTNYNAIDTYGLFAQDSPLFVFVSAIRNKLVPKINLNLFGYDLKQSDLFENTGDINQKLDLFGVNYLLLESNTIKEQKQLFANSNKLLQIGNFKIKNNSSKLYLYNTNFDYGVIEPLSYLPKYEPSANIVEKWKGLNKNNLYTKDSRVQDIKFDKVNIKPNMIKDLNVSNDKVSFYVNSEKDIPVLVKFADSHVLKVKNNDKFVNKYNVSPGLFFVYGKGHFEIYPQAPKMLHLLVLFSKLSILLISIYLIYSKLSIKRNSSI